MVGVCTRSCGHQPRTRQFGVMNHVQRRLPELVSFRHRSTPMLSAPLLCSSALLTLPLELVCSRQELSESHVKEALQCILHTIIFARHPSTITPVDKHCEHFPFTYATSSPSAAKSVSKWEKGGCGGVWPHNPFLCACVASGQQIG